MFPGWGDATGTAQWDRILDAESVTMDWVRRGRTRPRRIRCWSHTTTLRSGIRARSSIAKEAPGFGHGDQDRVAGSVGDHVPLPVREPEPGKVGLGDLPPRIRMRGSARPRRTPRPVPGS